MLYNFSNVLLYNLDIKVRDKQVDLRYRRRKYVSTHNVFSLGDKSEEFHGNPEKIGKSFLCKK